MTVHKQPILAAFWIGLYALLAILPLGVVFIGPNPPGRGFWTEFSVALGFVGLSMMSLQFAITARFRFITSPYGIDIIYQFHRHISALAFAFVLVHPLILFINNPGTLALLNPFTAPCRARAAVAAVLLLVLLIAISVRRERLGISYEAWRLTHGLLAIAVIVLSLWHALGVGHYLSMPWKQALWVGMSALAVWLTLYIRLIRPILLRRRPYIVEEVRPHRGNVYTIRLRADGHRGMVYRAGQFAWIRIGVSPFSIHEHPFSFSSSVTDHENPEFSIKSLGDFTSAVKDVRPGARAYIDGPYGVFTTDRFAGPGFVLIAGGVGITPMLSILRTAADRKDPRHHLLIYATQTWDDTTFRDELDELRGKLNFHVVHVLDKPHEGWTGETGYVDKPLLARHLPPHSEDLQHLLCGPPVMMESVRDGLVQLGIPLDRIHMEEFNFA